MWSPQELAAIIDDVAKAQTRPDEDPRETSGAESVVTDRPRR